MKSCLIVDDSKVVRKVARRILEDLHFEIEEAADGKLAMDACLKHMPDVILLDWNMPVMNGLEFLHALRGSAGGDAPVVVQSMCATRTIDVDQTVAQAHQLADKSMALSDCRTCHRGGSEAFQSVTISLVGPDGRRVGYGANADVLNSAISLDSVSGFYAIGGTRMKLLDILLVLAVLGGLSVPIGHLTLGWIFKRYGLARPQTGGHGGRPSGGDGPQAV